MVESSADEPPIAGLPPRYFTRFVGRHRELAELQRTLRSHRLVSLVGMGGSGKTRLAAELVGQPSGVEVQVVWADLTALTEGQQIAYAVADALALQAGAGREPAQIVHKAVGDAGLLLVLDNCEEFIADCAAFVGALLAACPKALVLATSRLPLRANGEVVVPLPPLAVQVPNMRERSEAAELFYDRAGAVLPAYPMLGGEVEAVNALVTRVDGLPLAIELAASWVRVLSARELLTEIERNAEALASTAPDLVGRHRSMRAVLDSSWRWLDEEDQRVLRGLGVFSGGFTREAAEAVCGASLTSLASLAERSLIRRVPHEVRTSRFELHELVRTYALEQLKAVGSAEFEAARLRHYDFFLPIAEERDGDGFTPIEPGWDHPLRTEQPNIEAALRWTMERDDAERALRLVSALDSFWAYAIPPLHVRRERAARVLAMPQKDLSEAGILARARAMEVMGYLSSPVDLNRAARYFEESRPLHEQLGHLAGVASCLRGIAWTSVLRGDVKTSQRFSKESLTICRLALDAHGEAWSVWQLGEAALVGADFPGTKRYTTEAQRLFDAVAGDYGSYCCDVQLADAYRGEGRIREALFAYGRALSTQQANLYRTGGEAVLDGIAQIAATLQRYDEAATLYGAGAAWRRSFPDYRQPYYQQSYDQAAVETRRHLSNRAWQDAYTAGDGLTAESAMQLAAGAIQEMSTVLEAAQAILTDREAGIIRLVAAGLRDTEIADQLALSPRTVHAHLRSIYIKLGVSTRTGAVHAARDLHVV